MGDMPHGLPCGLVTPAARISAAIAILDRIQAGDAAERALTGWARASRFAGSGDRAAVRDLVFTALRQRRSLGWVGGAESGRGLMIGLALAQGRDLATLFNGQGHAPSPLTAGEGQGDLTAAPAAVRLDQPDWLWPLLGDSLGPARDSIAAMLQQRAPVMLRVNLRRGDRAAGIAALAAAGIGTTPHPDIRTALEATDNASKIKQSRPYLTGLVELQDAASQAAMLHLPLVDGQRVLDYCAGGGGKALAIAALARVEITAHDIAPARMADLPARAARAGITLRLCSSAQLAGQAPFDVVLVDAPCSGSGTWRRAPEAKWRLTPQALDQLCATQGLILDAARQHVAPGGVLAYATCSVLQAENDAQIAAFLARTPGWRLQDTLRLWPDARQDGFYIAVLRRASTAAW